MAESTGVLNGVDLVLVPLLGTGLGSGRHLPSHSIQRHMSEARLELLPRQMHFVSAPMAMPRRCLPLLATLPQPYVPGVGGNVPAGDGSVLDPTSSRITPTSLTSPSSVLSARSCFSKSVTSAAEFATSIRVSNSMPCPPCTPSTVNSSQMLSPILTSHSTRARCRPCSRSLKERLAVEALLIARPSAVALPLLPAT